MFESLSLGKAFLLGKLRKSLTPSEYVLKRDYLGSSRYVQIIHLLAFLQ
jgi:hypothetical protein